MATTHKLRCFAYEVEPNKWYAHCITLCLDTTGSGYWEARRKLEALVDDYFDLVKERGLTKGLIPRRSPFSMQITYWKIWLLNLLWNHFVKPSSQRGQSPTFDCLANSMANA